MCVPNTPHSSYNQIGFFNYLISFPLNHKHQSYIIACSDASVLLSLFLSLSLLWWLMLWLIVDCCKSAIKCFVVGARHHHHFYGNDISADNGCHTGCFYSGMLHWISFTWQVDCFVHRDCCFLFSFAIEGQQFYLSPVAWIGWQILHRLMLLLFLHGWLSFWFLCLLFFCTGWLLFLFFSVLLSTSDCCFCFAFFQCKCLTLQAPSKGLTNTQIICCFCTLLPGAVCCFFLV